MNKKIKNLIVIVCFAIALLAVANFTLAQTADPWGGQEEAVGEAIGLGGDDPRIIAARVIRIGLGFLGLIALVLVIYAGWLWMTAAGNEERINQAKKILTNAIIGLIIILASFAIVSFILLKLQEATNPGEACEPVGATESCGNCFCGVEQSGTRTCQASGFWGSCVGFVCQDCPPPTASFFIRGTIPHNGAKEQIRNIVIKTYFNKELDQSINQTILDSNFKIEKIAENLTEEDLVGTAVNPPISVLGDVTITPERKEINFKAAADCGNEKGTLNCLDEWSKYKVVINNDSGLIAVGGQSLECFNNKCEFEFSTSDVIDTGPPTAGIIPEQICQDDDTLKPDANTIAGWGRDDISIAGLYFYQQRQGGNESLVYTEPGVGGKYLRVEHQYDTKAMVVGDIYIFRVEAADVADARSSDSFTTDIKPGHCCNGMQDADEEGIDCGGADCKSCDGGPCNLSEPNQCTSTNTSNCSDNLCISWFCDCLTNDCLCQNKPIIDWITPVGGFCEDDINKVCDSNDDCDPSDTCNKDTANGAADNLITIGGRWFGEYVAGKSKVEFSNNGTSWIEGRSPHTANANCDDNWHNDQIITVIPSGLNLGPGIIIKVTAGSLYADQTNDERGPFVDFVYNTIQRSGLCKLIPDNGVMNDIITYQGIRLINSKAYFGDIDNRVIALNPDFSGDTSGTANVPNISTGKRTSFTINIQNNIEISSNYLNFIKDSEPKTGPQIISFEPLQGPAGQYVTIYGSGFGRIQGTSKVYFGDESGEEASYDFPDVCADSTWSDNQVIVKVPEGLNPDPENFKIIMVFGSIVIDSSEIRDDKPNTSPTFRYDSTLPLVPSLCKIEPAIGPNNSPISLWGEYFGDKANGLVRFYKDKDQSGNEITFWGLDAEVKTGIKPYKIITTVDGEAITGPVRVVQNSLAGNGMKFNVGLCTSAPDPDAACGQNSICCPAGSTEAGRCKGDLDECYIKFASSVYEWDFTTKEGDVSEEYGSCIEYSRETGSCGSILCPNSPGQCSFYSGDFSVAGDCSNAVCENVAVCQGGICEFSNDLNKCKLIKTSCETSAGKINYTIFNAEDANALERIPADGIKTEGINKFYYEQGTRTSLSNEFIPVDTSKIYYIYGKFKSAGDGKVCVKNGNPVVIGAPTYYKHCTADPGICNAANGETCEPFQSRLYFGLAPYDENKNFIDSYKVLRKGNDVVITDLDNQKPGLTITVDQVISGWNGAGTAAGARSLGFYYDGDTAKVPDYIFTFYNNQTCSYALSPGQSVYYCTDANLGAYDGTSINGNKIINLNTPLPPGVQNSIKFGTTVVKNHYSGNAYLYSAAVNTAVPWNWEEISYNKGGITGEDWGNKMDVFRIGTKYIKLVLLQNYQQSNDEEIWFDDIVISSQECNKVNGKYIWQINNGGVSCPGGTYLDINGLCTIGLPGQPTSCSLEDCPNGFSCESGQCVAGGKVCPTGYSCNADQKCEGQGSSSCECCCRIGMDAYDCCYPLKCEGTCGSDTINDTAGFGQCSGCRIEENGVVNQNKSDDACNCEGTAGKFCDINDLEYPEGVCRDCAQLSTTECSNHATCCVDATKGDNCRGIGEGTSFTETMASSSNFIRGFDSWENREVDKCTVNKLGVESGEDGNGLYFNYEGENCADMIIEKKFQFKKDIKYKIRIKSKNIKGSDPDFSPANSISFSLLNTIAEPNLKHEASTDIEKINLNSYEWVYTATDDYNIIQIHILNDQENNNYINLFESIEILVVEPYNYCAFYNCEGGGEDKSCNIWPNKFGKYKDLNTCQKECIPKGITKPGYTCENVATSTPVCDTSICKDLSCLNFDGTGPGYPNCGRCCCKPNSDSDICKNFSPNLVCKPDQSPCTGDDRGLCCGCSQNEDCGDVDKVGCGNDTCCRARPEIDSFAPADDSVNVCRNAEIRATFNELMNISSFSGNIFVAGDYGFQDCPANTVFLAKDNINNDSIFIKAFKYLAKRFNFVNKLALAYTNPTVHNYCAVRGTVRGLNNPDNTTTISFTPYNLLDPSRLYYAIVNGQEDLKGATTGVMNIWGIGYNGPNGETDAPIGFNATKIIHGKIWSFTTLSEEQDRGICQIDRVKIFPNSYLFSTTENNLNDEKDDDPKDKSFDTIADSDKVFIAYALSADDQILAPTKGYWWNWNWSIENGQVVSIADAGLDADGDRQLIRANEGITDSKTNIYAQVNIEGRDDIKRGEAKVWVFLCENPWPPVNNEGLWQPWTDSGQGCLEDSGSCHDTNYEIYYCRDAGAEGTFDDLPAIEDNAVIRGQSTDNTLVCTDPFGNCIGKSKDSACGLNGKCVLAPNILKETYYFREVIPEIMTASFTAEDTKEGGEVLVTWVAPDDPNSADYPTSYKIYYRLKNVSSYSSLEVVSSEVCQTDPCSKLVTGLENEKEYIFSLSSLNEGRAESELFKEISVTPTKQITKPAKPIGLKAAIINPGNKIRVEWKPNADGVTKGYILYYGTSHAIYGKEVDVGDVINYTFDIVGGYAMYFISLKAYDEYDNLSNEYADEIIVIPEKKDFYFVNTLTNVDFENGVVGKVPVDWARSEQKHVKIAITDERAFSGIQSMLLHQDPGIIYPGICRQDICEDYDANNGTDLCFWVPGTPNKCRFTILDREGNIEKEENQVLVLDNTYRVSWGKLVYRIGALNFQVGKQYLIAFYYKGQSASDIKPQLGASLGHISQCESRSKPSVEAKFQDSCTYEMIDDANLDELTDEEKKHWMNYWPCKECDNGRDGGVCYPKCSEQPDSICLNPPFQTKCYQPLRPYCANDINKLCNIDADCVGSTCIKLDSISRQPEYVGPYNGWKLYLEIITFNEELDSHKDKFGKPLNEIGLTIGYNPTSPYCANDSNKLCSEGCDPGVSCINIADGTDIYIDNFIVAEAVEAVEN